jgi:predicted DNA-binding protein
MPKSTTTSIRLPTQLVDQLEHASSSLQRGKNWIIIRALEEYLASLNKESLMVEAKRQSLIANQADQKNDTWDEEMDTSGWT